MILSLPDIWVLLARSHHKIQMALEGFVRAISCSGSRLEVSFQYTDTDLWLYFDH